MPFTDEFLRECFYIEDDVIHWAVRPEHHFPHAAGMKRWNSRHAGNAAYKGVRLQNRSLPLNRIRTALGYKPISRKVGHGHTPLVIDPLFVREMYDYDPGTGILYWARSRPVSHFKREWSHRLYLVRHSGKPAGTVSKNGYLVVRTERGSVGAHRVAWAYQTGRNPEGHIDHINGNRQDNRWVNLRDVTARQNNRNRPDFLPPDGLYEQEGAWGACFNDVALGVFDTKEEAVAARFAAERYANGAAA